MTIINRHVGETYTTAGKGHTPSPGFAGEHLVILHSLPDDHPFKDMTLRALCACGDEWRVRNQYEQEIYIK